MPKTFKQILTYFGTLTLVQKWIFLIGPIVLILYFLPDAHSVGLFKIYTVANAIGLLLYYLVNVGELLFNKAELDKKDLLFLAITSVIFIGWSILNLHLEKGLHMDEIWRIDRSRQFVVFNDYDYGDFRGYPISKSIEGVVSLLGVFDLQSLNWLHFGDSTALFMRILLGVVPSAIIPILLFAIIKPRFGQLWAAASTLLLLLSYNFLDFSRTFLTEPLLGLGFILVLGVMINIFETKNNAERNRLQRLLLPLFVTTFLLKYTIIIALPVVLLAYFWEKKVEASKKHLLPDFWNAASIYIAFTPYLATLDGFVSLAKGPIRGISPVLRNNIIDTELGLLITIGAIITAFLLFCLILIIKNFNWIYSYILIRIQTYTLHLLLLFTAYFLILGFFQSNDAISIFHYANLAKTDLLILVLSTIGIIFILKNPKEESYLKILAISSIFILITTAISAGRITDVYARHIFPYLPILIILASFALVKIQRFAPFLKYFAIPLIIIFSMIQLHLFPTSLHPDETWEYEYWTITENSTTSIKEFTDKINALELCSGFVFDDGQAFWSHHKMGGIVYYYNPNCGTSTLLSQNPFEKLRVTDFYLRKERQKQIENPYYIGLYNKLIPVITSAQTEVLLENSEIAAEYALHTNSDYMISRRRDIMLPENVARQIGNAKFIPIETLGNGFVLYKIDRGLTFVDQDTRWEEKDAKNYVRSARQITIEPFIPEPDTPREDYPYLFDNTLIVGPTKVEYPNETVEINELTTLQKDLSK